MDERERQRRGYPLTVPEALLRSDAMQRACAARNFQEVFRLVNRRTGSSHAAMAAAIGKMTSSRVSDIIRGARGIRGREVIERVADGFGIPGDMLGLPKRPWESPVARRPEAPDSAAGPGADIAHMRSAVAHVVEHDNRFGADAVAPVAVQVWKAGKRKLASGAVPEQWQREYLGAVSEIAEVAGWLLFDSGQDEQARAAFLESHMLARQAGDSSKEWFALDLMAMQHVYSRDPHEALRLAEELVSLPRVPPRVALASATRRVRSLGQSGDRAGTLAALGKMWRGYEQSVSPRDPAWTWWLDEGQLRGQEGEAFLDLGDLDAAETALRRAIELNSATMRQGRSALHWSISLLSTYSAAGAWRECEAALLPLPPMLDIVTSGRQVRRLRTALRGITRAPDCPTWLSDLAQDMARLPQLAA